MLPQLSVTDQLLVVEYEHPVPATSLPTFPVAVRPALQLSVTVAPPKAAAMSVAVGLHPRTDAAVSVMDGFSVSLV